MPNVDLPLYERELISTVSFARGFGPSRIDRKNRLTSIRKISISETGGAMHTPERFTLFRFFTSFIAVDVELKSNTRLVYFVSLFLSVLSKLACYI